MYSRKKQSGFTLIEIAIVLVIIGLLLGGVLKGQELITSARVRNLISIQDGYKAAFYGFQDRYRALPGDYASASTTINCTPTCVNGNGDGRIETAAQGAPIDEQTAVWEHLSKSGFISGSYTYAAGAPTDQSTPKNPYSVYMQFEYDANYGKPGSGNTSKLNLKTGNQIPVEILAEVDRKIDDGDPYRGSFQFSDYTASGTPLDATACVTASGGTSPNVWKTTGTTSSDCGGATLF